MGKIGTTIKQANGYAAFIPEPFPPAEMPALDNQALGLLEQATTALGRLDGVTDLLPDVDFFIFMYVRKEAALSSQLEGTQATMIDAIKAESSVRAGVPEDVDDILRYTAAMNYGIERLKEFPLSMRLLLEVHDQLMTGGRSSGHALPGQFRTTQNWIGGTSLATARFVPPPPSHIGQSLSDIERYLHSEGVSSTLLKAGLSHAQFETIHPFADGNGRTGRLLITFYLCQQGVLRRPVLYLSEFFKKHRTLYFDLLQNYHEKDDILPWIKFFFEGVLSVADEATETCRKVTNLRERDMNRIAQMGKAAPLAVQALKLLFKNPFVTAKYLEQELKISRQAANMLARRLVEAEILTPEDPVKEYGRSYWYQDYMDAFA